MSTEITSSPGAKLPSSLLETHLLDPSLLDTKLSPVAPQGNDASSAFSSPPLRSIEVPYASSFASSFSSISPARSAFLGTPPRTLDFRLVPRESSRKRSAQNMTASPSVHMQSLSLHSPATAGTTSSASPKLVKLRTGMPPRQLGNLLHSVDSTPVRSAKTTPLPKVSLTPRSTDNFPRFPSPTDDLEYDTSPAPRFTSLSSRPVSEHSRSNHSHQPPTTTTVQEPLFPLNFGRSLLHRTNSHDTLDRVLLDDEDSDDDDDDDAFVLYAPSEATTTTTSRKCSRRTTDTSSSLRGLALCRSLTSLEDVRDLQTPPPPVE